MFFRHKFPWTYGIARIATGRLARRVYFIFVLLLILAVIAPRVRSMLMAQKIHAVLSGMEQLRIDETSEQELLRTVPYAVRYSRESRSDVGVERYYYVEITNERDWEWLAFRPVFTESMRAVLVKILDWCGYRYMRFDARMVVLDGEYLRSLTAFLLN